MTIAIAQHPAVVASSGSTSVSATFASACSNPSLIVAELSDNQSDTTTYTISDGVNAGNYAVDARKTNTGAAAGSFASVNSKQNTSTTALTVTATLSAGDYVALSIYELTGAATSAALDAQATGSGSGSLQTLSLGITTTAANSSIIASTVGYPAGIETADTGFTISTLSSGYNGYSFGEYKADAGAAGTTTLTYNTAPAAMSFWTMAIAAYKAAAAGPTPTGTLGQFDPKLRIGAWF